MGACGVSGVFNHTDWRAGIQEVKDDYTYNYGYQEGYSGGPNCVSFSYAGDKSDLTKKQLEKFVNERMAELYKRDGEVIISKHLGYKVFTTDFEEYDYKDSVLSNLLSYRDKKRPATLLVARVYWGSHATVSVDKIIASGTIAEMKQEAHKYIRGKDYVLDGYSAFIVTKNKILRVYGAGKEYKNTTKKSNQNQLVVPYNEYVWYGIAPE